MNEANQNANSFDAESLWHEPSDRAPQNESARLVSDSNAEQLKEQPSDLTSACQSNTESELESLTTKMDWQKVAHKLREYNRKLLKKVFRLEQELADINNNYNKYLEKSKNSDLLLVQQAEELESEREKTAIAVEQLTNFQQQLEERELTIEQISQQHQLSQQQAAQLERECTLLQEKYNQKAFELVAQEKENQELQSELSQQRHLVLQQEAELERYREAASRKEKAASRNQNYPHNRYIQPWSNSTIPEPKIALPKTKSSTQKAARKSGTETIETAAKIATWSASTVAEKKVERATTTTTKVQKSQPAKKPQSLAAVDLPTFPRPK